MLFFEISIFASDVFVSKNRPKGHGILLFLVMERHEKSWNLNFQKEYEPCYTALTNFLKLSFHQETIAKTLFFQMLAVYV